MNLAETKKALEASVKSAVQQSLDGNITVDTNYDANEGNMYVNLVKAQQQEKGQNTTVYNMRFTETDRNLVVLAFSRVVMNDNYGPAYAENQPVSIDSKFINDMTTIISIGLDMGYHPENYQAPAKPEENTNNNESDDSAAE